MVNRYSMCLPLALLVACAASTGEDVTASRAAVTGSALTNLIVLPTNTTLSFAVTAPASAAAYTVSIRRIVSPWASGRARSRPEVDGSALI